MTEGLYFRNSRLFENLDDDLTQSLKAQLRNLWTHASTALEGNTLTLGETAFVIEEGLTVSGKPLKDHEEVVGHARAIELIYLLLERAGSVTREDLFDLHKAVQTERIYDIYKPVGKWKVEQNGTTIVTADQRQLFLEYALPQDVPALMDDWLALLNAHCLAEFARNREYHTQQAKRALRGRRESRHPAAHAGSLTVKTAPPAEPEEQAMVPP